MLAECIYTDFQHATLVPVFPFAWRKLVRMVRYEDSEEKNSRTVFRTTRQVHVTSILVLVVRKLLPFMCGESFDRAIQVIISSYHFGEKPEKFSAGEKIGRQLVLSCRAHDKNRSIIINFPLPRMTCVCIDDSSITALKWSRNELCRDNYITFSVENRQVDEESGSLMVVTCSREQAAVCSRRSLKAFAATTPGRRL